MTISREAVIEAMKLYDKVKFTVPQGFTEAIWSHNMHMCNLAIATFEPVADKKKQDLQKIIKKGGMK